MRRKAKTETTSSSVIKKSLLKLRGGRTILGSFINKKVLYLLLREYI
jgi:hypothetical protein